MGDVAGTGAGGGGVPVGAAGDVTGTEAGGGVTAAAPRATRTPLAFIHALNSSAVIFLPFWLMLKRHGVLSNSVRGLYAAGSSGLTVPGAGVIVAMFWQLSMRMRSKSQTRMPLLD